MVGLDLCTQVLWKFALRIKDDQTRAFSERKAIVNVLNKIHQEFMAEMEKINGPKTQLAPLATELLRNLHSLDQERHLYWNLHKPSLNQS